MVRSPPALHLGRLGDEALPFAEPADGGAGGALGVMYVSLNCCFGMGGRVDARFGGTISSIGDCSSGPEIDLPFTVGVWAAPSGEDSVDGEVSVPEDKLIVLTLLFTGPEAISLRGIEFLELPESTLEMVEFSVSLDCNSCEDLEVI